MGGQWGTLAGTDRPGSEVLPLGEFLQPAPLAAAVLLGVNDWLLKGQAALPGWLTGKLSDFAGLFFAPLLLTSIVDCALFALARAGLRVDFSLRRWKALLAVALVGSVFAAIKLSPGAADVFAAAVRAVFGRAQVVADPTDLVALVALAPSYWIARREIATVPLGRLAVIERNHRQGGDSPGDLLADLPACGADPASTEALARGMEQWLSGASDDSAARKALTLLRAS